MSISRGNTPVCHEAQLMTPLSNAKEAAQASININITGNILKEINIQIKKGID